ncbi:Zinc/iron permease [Auriscalpium vulgare]|uniref:Zinc/iron permease n=1 Tax=Auriscalpium vulgare TaxID=40419 RepID=A0ACB8RVQ3_9AGAM|nr:Zinc/iron permease [Auriscalpium vulgare]
MIGHDVTDAVLYLHPPHIPAKTQPSPPSVRHTPPTSPSPPSNTPSTFVPPRMRVSAAHVPIDDAAAIAPLHGWMAAELETKLSVRIGMMAVIFCVSLFAASFPTVSKRVKYLHIPRIVFFVGKHFGTGVILSTAFVHLLQDAFESLLDPEVQRETSVGHWTGFILLVSLLLIFFIEYSSTSFVDYLHSYPSAPSSPKLETSNTPLPPLSESTPLLAVPVSAPASPSARRHSIASLQDPAHAHHENLEIFQGHHRHEPRLAHAEHHEYPRRGSVLLLDAELGVSPGDVIKPALSQDGHAPRPQHNVPGHGHQHRHAHLDLESLAEEDNDDEDCSSDAAAAAAKLEIGRKRQVVGILVLQFGIMIHSLVIGLTLAIASGADFTSLVAAIVFHQLFEGLSLGIRIAGLPAPRDPSRGWLWLKPVLALLFAVTTPAGITIGLLTFGVGSGSGGVRLKLIEGLMSAISAGMLIYAACVEMLAGDFVLDPTLWRAGVARQLTALGSLLAGAAGMTLLGSVH